MIGWSDILATSIGVLLVFVTACGINAALNKLRGLTWNGRRK